jgi:hypothetical protein
MAIGNPGSSLTAELNRLANGGTYPVITAYLDAQGAANKWAATTGLSVNGALNVKNGVTNPSLWKDLDAVCNALGGTTGLAAPAALRLRSI